MAGQAEEKSISAVHPDIIRTHILTRLDGEALGSASCASSQLNSLCSEEKLWAQICNLTWPSTADPQVSGAVSSFPSGHRSLFSDSYSTPDFPLKNPRRPSPAPRRLISAVDLHYEKDVVFSKVKTTDPSDDWFLASPFRIDLLETKEMFPTAMKFDSFPSDLEDKLTLSWILIDPARKRSVNLSSVRPVSVHRHWLMKHVQVQYAVVIPRDVFELGSSEFVNCRIEVTCRGKEGGELEVSEVSLQVQDMDGKSLSGRDSMTILQQAMTSGRRKRHTGEGRERYREYLEMKRERKERAERRERRMDMVCIATGISIFVAIVVGFLLRI